MRLLPRLMALGAAGSLARASFWGNKSELRGQRQAVRCEASCASCEACPLSSLGVGEAGCLLQVGAGRRLRRRLAELGLTPGVRMTVLQNAGGPVLICVRNSRLALGRQMAHKLAVLPMQAKEM